MYETYLSLTEYYKKCLEIARSNDFIWTICLLSRKADTETLYEKIVDQWTSLDDITGKRILFIFSSNKFKSPTIICKSKQNRVDGYINPFFKVSNNFPLFGMNYGFGKIMSQPKKKLIDEHSRTISSMAKYLELMEEDIPCLVVTNLLNNKKFIIKITDEFDCYNFIKLMIELMEEQLLDYDKFIEENPDFLELQCNHLKFTKLTEDIKDKAKNYSNEIQEILSSYLEDRRKEDFKKLKNLIKSSDDIKQLKRYNNWYRHFNERIRSNTQYNDNKKNLNSLIESMDYTLEQLSRQISIDKKSLKLTNCLSELDIVNKICLNFKSFIEDNGGWRICENRDEKIVQTLFYCMADSYCQANNLDLSPEVNSGRGPVDFKISYGNLKKILVEIKLTSNSKLKNGIQTQLPIYLKQEKTSTGIYLIYDNGNPEAIKRFKEFYEKLPEDEKIPYYIIDGTSKISASKA